MATTCKIVQMRIIPSPRPDRLGKQDRVIIVQAGEGPPLILQMPDETFSEAGLTEEVRKHLAAVSGLVGKTFEV
jgi:hypothetical protein